MAFLILPAVSYVLVFHPWSIVPERTLRPLTFPACSQPDCGWPASRAILNVFGCVFFECSAHSGWPGGLVVGRIPDGAAIDLALASYPRIPESLSVVLPPGEALALLVMEG